MPAKFHTPQSLNRGKLKQLLHFHPKKKPMRLKHIWKPTVAEVSPTVTSETSNPTRLTWVGTSEIGKSYNFFRFRGGLDPLSNPPQMQTWVCKTLYYPFLISTNQCPYERNNFRCSSQLSGISLRSLSKINVSGWRLSHINFTISGHNKCSREKSDWKLYQPYARA